jgi:AcrR family transcriptional regulator
MRATKTPRKPAYHHGNLALALIDHAMAQVRTAGADSLSLREAAKAAGVTAGAVYKHFDSRDALLAAVSKEGFRQLARLMHEGTLRRSGRARLLAVGQAYIAFASREQHLFRLMFSRIEARSPAGLPQAGLDERTPFDHLRAALADLSGSQPGNIDATLAAHAWCVAHGAASLISEGFWSPNDPRANAALSSFVDFATTANRKPAHR